MQMASLDVGAQLGSTCRVPRQDAFETVFGQVGSVICHHLGTDLNGVRAVATTWFTRRDL
jgi:hypothetical protein